MFQQCSEYNALLIRMQIADEIGIKNLEAYGDSKLIINQVRGEYEVRHEDLVSYFNATISMAERFGNFYIDHIPCQQNVHADALASLIASLALPPGVVEKNLSIATTCIAQESLLKIVKSRQETVKPKKLLRRQRVQSLGIGDSRTLTMPCTTFCLMIPKRGCH